MARVRFVKKARKDNPVAKKGESYYWWSTMISGRGVVRYSKNKPSRSQLTNSEFLATMYDLEDEANGLLKGADKEENYADFLEDVKSSLEDIKDQVQEQGNECEDKRNSMPDSLQESPTGELLQNRVEQCEQIVSGIDEAISDIDDIINADSVEADWLERAEEAISQIDWSVE